MSAGVLGLAVVFATGHLIWAEIFRAMTHTTRGHQR